MQTLQRGVALFGLGWQEADKVKLVAQQTAGRQGGNGGRGAGQRHHAQAGGTHRIDDARPRVRNGRGAGVRHQRDALAGSQPDDQFFSDFALVVLMRGNQTLRQTVARQQVAGVARIFAGHRIHQRQHVQAAQRDVGEVSDRCCQHI